MSQAAEQMSIKAANQAAEQMSIEAASQAAEQVFWGWSAVCPAQWQGFAAAEQGFRSSEAFCPLSGLKIHQMIAN